jgi:hypothetical protein
MAFYEGAANWDSLISNEVTWRLSASKDHIQSLANQEVADLTPSAFIAERRRMIVMGESSA